MEAVKAAVEVAAAAEAVEIDSEEEEDEEEEEEEEAGEQEQEETPTAQGPLQEMQTRNVGQAEVASLFQEDVRPSYLEEATRQQADAHEQLDTDEVVEEEEML